MGSTPPPEMLKFFSHCEKICNIATPERLLLSATLVTFAVGMYKCGSSRGSFL